MDISFHQATVSFANRQIILPLTLHLTERRIGIIGLNGSGKTTFSRMINGLVLPSSGSVFTNTFDTKQDVTKVRECVGYVFQNPANQIVLPLIKDDIALGLKAKGLDKNEIDQTINHILKRVGIEHLSERRAHELSGGEIQLAALASVLALQPDIVILDEPTNQLDLKNRNMVQRVIESLAENVIVVTHDLSLIKGFERVLLFDQGKIVADGLADTVIEYYLKIANE